MSSLIRKTLLFISVKMILGLLVLMAGSLGYAEPSIFYVHNDHLGTPQKVTNASETVVWEADYLPFGEATVNADPDGDQTDFELNIRFPGQYHDIETGTYYNYYRDYDPRLGRYIQSDPRGINLDFSDPQRQVAAQIGVPVPTYPFPGSLNYNYGYVNQNPLIYTDQTGEVAWDPVVFTTLVVGGGLVGGVSSALTTDGNKADAFVDGFIFGATTGGVASFGTTLTGKIIGSLLGSTISGLSAVGSVLDTSESSCDK